MTRVQPGKYEHEGSPQVRLAAELALEFCERSVPSVARTLLQLGISVAKLCEHWARALDHSLFLDNPKGAP
jgi:hypothetical protein